MTQGFGRDLKTVVDAHGNVDITPGGLESTGRQVLAERLVRRVTTPRGSVEDVPNECFDIRDWLSKEFNAQTMSQLRATVRQEMLNDVGVIDCSVQVAFDNAAKKLTVRISVRSSEGNFVLTVNISQLTLDLLVTDT